MSEEEKERKAKWEQPELEEFQERENGAAEGREQKKHGNQHGGCRPMAGGCHPFGMCSPGRNCYPRGSWQCAPQQVCAPYMMIQMLNPYCRPNGFNYGYGCFPRR